MVKIFSAAAMAVFLWTFWFASSLGVYIGTFPSDFGEPQCRYVTARGFFDEAKDGVALKHSTNPHWCPATLIFARDKDAQYKTASFSARKPVK